MTPFAGVFRDRENWRVNSSTPPLLPPFARAEIASGMTRRGGVAGTSCAAAGHRSSRRLDAATGRGGASGRESRDGRTRGAGGAGGDELEIHLFFEGVHFADLHGDLIAEFDDTAGAAADEMAARCVEHVEVVFDGGEWHQAAHAQPWHVHKETEVAGVGHQRRIDFAPSRFDLGLEEGKEFDILAVAFGVGGIALGFGNVKGDVLERRDRGTGAVK